MSKLSDYSHSGSSVFTPRGRVFHLEPEERLSFLPSFLPCRRSRRGFRGVFSFPGVGGVPREPPRGPLCDGPRFALTCSWKYSVRADRGVAAGAEGEGAVRTSLIEYEVVNKGSLFRFYLPVTIGKLTDTGL